MNKPPYEDPIAQLAKELLSSAATAQVEAAVLLARALVRTSGSWPPRPLNELALGELYNRAFEEDSSRPGASEETAHQEGCFAVFKEGVRHKTRGGNATTSTALIGQPTKK